MLRVVQNVVVSQSLEVMTVIRVYTREWKLCKLLSVFHYNYVSILYLF